MFAVLLSGTQADPQVEVGSMPPPGDQQGRLTIDVAAAGVTKMEPHWLTGWQKEDGSPQTRPMALGHEFAGTVRSVGAGVATFSAGDRVLGQIEAYRSGAMVEAVSASADEVVPLPTGVPIDAASTLPLAGLTAWQAIVRYGALQRGQTVLIHGGNGGVGTFAVQIAKQLGAYVVATADEQYLALCRELGADEVIDYKREPFEDRDIHYDLVFDQIGGDTQERSWSVLKRGGRLITIAGEEKDAPDQKRARALGVTAHFFVVDWNGVELRRLLDLVISGEVRPIIGHRFTRETIAEAFGEAGPVFAGKGVLVLRES